MNLEKLGRALRRRELSLSVESTKGATLTESGRWRTTTDRAAFVLRSEPMPTGWAAIDFECDFRPVEGVPPRVVVETADGREEIVRLPAPEKGHIRGLMRLPRTVRKLRLEPNAVPGEIRLARMRLRLIGANEAAIRLALPIAGQLLMDPRRLFRAARKVGRIFRRGGVVALRHGLIDKAQAAVGDRYAEWHHHYGTLRGEDVAEIRSRVGDLATRPTLSFLLFAPRAATPDQVFRTVASVQAQLYPEWRLWLAHEEERSAGPDFSDPRVQTLDGAFESAAAACTAFLPQAGDFVAFLDAGDEIAPEAAFLIARAIATKATLDLIYCDEDRLLGGGRAEPHFKPDWNPELLESWMYVGRLAAYRSSLVRECGGARPAFGSAWEYDLCLRVSSRARAIHHVSRIAYHRASMPGVDPEAAAAALREARPGARVKPGLVPGTLDLRPALPHPAPLATLIIPTRDGFDYLDRCVQSIFGRTTYPAFEVLIVDNQSREPRVLELMERLAREGRARVLRHDRPFNYSEINNRAAKEARGDILVLLNNDVEIITPDWLDALVADAARPEIGAVGAKLLYPDDKLQHAGVLLGLGGVAGHIFRRLGRSEAAYFGRPQVRQAIGAVTAACLAVRKEAYEAVGGLDEVNLKVAFNDVDFCLKLLEAGFRNLYLPSVELYHHESVSRGQDDSPEKKARFNAEYSYLLRRWNGRLSTDPAHNPNLSLESFDIVAAFPPRAPPPWR